MNANIEVCLPPSGGYTQSCAQTKIKFARIPDEKREQRMKRNSVYNPRISVHFRVVIAIWQFLSLLILVINKLIIETKLQTSLKAMSDLQKALVFSTFLKSPAAQVTIIMQCVLQWCVLYSVLIFAVVMSDCTTTVSHRATTTGSK